MPMIYGGDGTHAHDLCLVIILNLEPSPFFFLSFGIYGGDGTHAHDFCLVIVLILEPSPFLFLFVNVMTKRHVLFLLSYMTPPSYVYVLYSIRAKGAELSCVIQANLFGSRNMMVLIKQPLPIYTPGTSVI